MNVGIADYHDLGQQFHPGSPTEQKPPSRQASEGPKLPAPTKKSAAPGAHPPQARPDPAAESRAPSGRARVGAGVGPGPGRGARRPQGQRGPVPCAARAPRAPLRTLPRPQPRTPRVHAERPRAGSSGPRPWSWRPTWPLPTENRAHQTEPQQPLDTEGPGGRVRARPHFHRCSRFPSALGLRLVHHLTTLRGPARARMRAPTGEHARGTDATQPALRARSRQRARSADVGKIHSRRENGFLNWLRESAAAGPAQLLSVPPTTSQTHLLSGRGK